MLLAACVGKAIAAALTVVCAGGVCAPGPTCYMLLVVDCSLHSFCHARIGQDLKTSHRVWGQGCVMHFVMYIFFLLFFWYLCIHPNLYDHARTDGLLLYLYTGGACSTSLALSCSGMMLARSGVWATTCL